MLKRWDAPPLPLLSTSTPTVAARAQIFTDEPVKDVIVEVKVCDLQSYTRLIYS
jgi:hypothetical protein